MRTVIQTPTPNVEESKAFYTILGFVSLSTKPTPIFSDGKCIIEINPERYARSGVISYRKQWNSKLIEELRNITPVLETPKGYKLCLPSGTWIYLTNSKQDYSFNLESINPSVLGNNVGISIETPNLKISRDILRLIGFANQEGDVEKGWVSLTNEESFTISLMKPDTSPHLFFNPSLTYFNGENNLTVIEKVRALNIPITEEITHFNKDGTVDNIITRDPGGLGFFLFND